MNTKLEINGVERQFNPEAPNLEGVLVSIMKENALNNEDIISEVLVNGELFSEEYPHQAREINLEEVNKIEIKTTAKEQFAQDFLNDISIYIENLIHGFKTSANLLRDPEEEINGFDILARSLEMLYALKAHLTNAWLTLGKQHLEKATNIFWDKFNPVADRIVKAQEIGSLKDVADLVEEQICPFLTEWNEELKSY